MTTLDVSTPFKPDPDVLARLREIDPSADLIYLGEGKWALGVVAPVNTPRRFTATMLARKFWSQPEEKRNPAVLRLAQAARQGFRVVSQYNEPEVHNGYMVHDFRVADFVYRKGRDAAFEKLIDNCDDEPDEEAIREAALYQARDAWQYIMRGKKHFIPK